MIEWYHSIVVNCNGIVDGLSEGFILERVTVQNSNGHLVPHILVYWNIEEFELRNPNSLMIECTYPKVSDETEKEIKKEIMLFIEKNEIRLMMGKWKVTV